MRTADVLLEATMGALFGLLLVEDRRAFRERLLRIGHEGQRLHVQLDERGRFLGGDGILCDDAHDGLAGEADLADAAMSG